MTVVKTRGELDKKKVKKKNSLGKEFLFEVLKNQKHFRVSLGRSKKLIDRDIVILLREVTLTKNIS